MKFNWNILYESLLARSVYLITIPIVLIQIVGIIIFFELHWDLVLKRSAQSISNEIDILEMQKNSSQIVIPFKVAPASKIFFKKGAKSSAG